MNYKLPSFFQKYTRTLLYTRHIESKHEKFLYLKLHKLHKIFKYNSVRNLLKEAFRKVTLRAKVTLVESSSILVCSAIKRTQMQDL